LSEGPNKKHLVLATARKTIYSLLSSFYLELPDINMIKSIFEPEFEKRIAEVASVFETGEMKEGLNLISGFISEFRDMPGEETLRLISVDRTRMFRGLSEKYSPPPPYESVYREQRLSGQCTTEVVQFYHKMGVSLPAELPEPPDYLGIEIDFMRHLCQNEEEAWGRGQAARAIEFLQASFDFLCQHLLRWAPQFCQKMVELCKLDFFKGLAKLTAGFLEYDSHLVEGEIKNIKAER